MPTERIESLDTTRIAKIMTIAFEEFGAASYHKTSYNRIIQRCGCSKGTMYYYFKSKEDLFLTLLKAVSREFGYLNNAQPMPEDQNVFWKGVKTTLRDTLMRLKAKPLVASFITSLLAAENRNSSHPASSLIMRIDEKLEDYLITGQLIGAVRRDLPIELLTELVWSIWDTVTSWSQKEGVMISEDSRVDAFFDLLGRCLEQTQASPKSLDHPGQMQESNEP
jgi:AcrR family transcriptional regulator